MAWEFTASYRKEGADFKQGEEIKAIDHLDKTVNYQSALFGVGDDTQEGICWALSLIWCEIMGTKPLEPDDAVSEVRSNMRYATILQRIYINSIGFGKTYGKMLDAMKDEMGLMKDIAILQKPGVGLDNATINFKTLTRDIPYVVSYKWANKASGHAIAYFPSSDGCNLFDPNCGHLWCAPHKAPTMWNDYWTDVTMAFNERPATAGIYKTTWEKAKPKKKKCIFSLAAAMALGLPSDAEALELLRQHRDQHLLLSAEGAQQVADYYAIAPSAAEAISRHPDAVQISEEIYQRWIRTAANAIELGEHERANAIFQEVLHETRNRFTP